MLIVSQNKGSGANRPKGDQATIMTEVPSISFPFTPVEGEAAGHIPLPVDPRQLFGRARPPVIVALNGYRYRSTVAIMSGDIFVPLRRSHREAAGLVSGRPVEVTLTLDTAPREVEVPDDLAAALGDAGLRGAWDRLSYSHRREHVEAVAGAKRPETRARRIAAILSRLRR